MEHFLKTVQINFEDAHLGIWIPCRPLIGKWFNKKGYWVSISAV